MPCPVAQMWKNSLLPKMRASGASMVSEGSHVINSAVHALQTPITGLLHDAENVGLMGMGMMGSSMTTSLFHLAAGVATGWVIWEMLHLWFPETGYYVSQSMTRPFKKQRRMPLDSY